MERREILETLKKFGLSDYESRAYTALVMKGPSKAGEICREADVPQSKIYDTMTCLMEKQLIEMFDGRPKEFKAVPPDVVLKSLMDEKEEEFRGLRSTVSSVIDVLRPLEKESLIEGIWTQKGEKSREVLNRLASMIDRSTSYVYDITRDFSFSTRYRESIKSCLKRGVKVMTICIGGVNKANCYNAKWYGSLNLPVRVFKTSIHPRVLVIDGKECSIRLDNDPLKNRFTFQSMWSQEPSLVKLFDTYVKGIWKISKHLSVGEINRMQNSNF